MPLLEHMLTLLAVDEILLPRYVNRSTNFRGQPLRVDRIPSRLKHMKDKQVKITNISYKNIIVFELAHQLMA